MQRLFICQKKNHERSIMTWRQVKHECHVASNMHELTHWESIKSREDESLRIDEIHASKRILQESKEWRRKYCDKKIKEMLLNTLDRDKIEWFRRQKENIDYLTLNVQFLELAICTSLLKNNIRRMKFTKDLDTKIFKICDYKHVIRKINNIQTRVIFAHIIIDKTCLHTIIAWRLCIVLAVNHFWKSFAVNYNSCYVILFHIF